MHAQVLLDIEEHLLMLAYPWSPTFFQTYLI